MNTNLYIADLLENYAGMLRRGECTVAGFDNQASTYQLPGNQSWNTHAPTGSTGAEITSRLNVQFKLPASYTKISELPPVQPVSYKPANNLAGAAPVVTNTKYHFRMRDNPFEGQKVYFHPGFSRLYKENTMVYVVELFGGSIYNPYGPFGVEPDLILMADSEEAVPLDSKQRVLFLSQLEAMFSDHTEFARFEMLLKYISMGGIVTVSWEIISPDGVSVHASNSNAVKMKTNPFQDASVAVYGGKKRLVDYARVLGARVVKQYDAFEFEGDGSKNTIDRDVRLVLLSSMTTSEDIKHKLRCVFPNAVMMVERDIKDLFLNDAQLDRIRYNGEPVTVELIGSSLPERGQK